MPTSLSLPPSAPEAAPSAVPTSGARKMKPISVPQRAPDAAPGRGEVHHLVELDVPLLVLDHDDGVAELDQVFALEGEDLLTDFLGLLLGREGDENQIAHEIELPC